MEDRPKILIVDDRPENLFALEGLLRPLGVNVVKAGSGNEALKATLNHDFALAIVDVQMPGMDGYELAKLLRGPQETRTIPIIFLTALYSDEAHVFMGYESGAVDFISKPFKPEILLAKVRVFLELDRTRRELLRQKAALESLVQERELANQRLQREIAERLAVEKELQAAKENLEGRVMERTAELAEANRGLQDYAKKLEDRSAEIQEFVFIASHDLQEPLRKVQMFGQRLRDEFAESLGSEGQDFLSRMEAAAKRMQTFLHDLLDYSRVTSRPNPLAFADLGRIIREAMIDLDQRLETTGGRIEIGNLMEAEVDSSQMCQLFQNLLSNALKYHSTDLPLVEVGGETIVDNGREMARIYVQDNGIGFDEQYLDKIFKPFQRLHGKSAYEGTGMGLAIVKKIIERHHGSITARSAPGQGARFIITLPVRQQPENG